MYVMNFDPITILDAYNPRTQASRIKIKCLVLMSLHIFVTSTQKY